MAAPSDRRRLATTRWSLVLAAANPAAPEARVALATLCETYCVPVYDFIRYSGRPTDEARELTQAFFTRVIERGDFGHARRERGRFRSFLLTAVRHFLANQAEYERAQKRGGNRIHVPIDAPADEHAGRAAHEPQSRETPETIYERRWALATLETAMSRLGHEYESTGRGGLFARLQPLITGDAGDSYAAVAASLDMTEAAARVAVHRLRRHYGRVLRATLAETVDAPEDVDAELRYLFDVLNRQPASSSLKQT
jgi:RNA polymerase sigma-70 factor (ECF subfamily)